jgi:phosphoglycolate phosphatase-like HAD superfamily hydrolase
VTGRSRSVCALLAIAALACGCSRREAGAAAPPDPLPSWRQGPARKAILAFLGRATTEGSRDFLPVAERIATFDNDGTLWPEQPIIQGAFVAARVRALAAKDRTLARRQPFQAVLEEDMAYLERAGEAAAAELLAATSANMTDEQFSDEVKAFFDSARHPKLGVLFTRLAYRPMVELIALLQQNGFRTYISSGGGTDFMRVVSQQMYRIPPEQVIGSSLRKEVRRMSGGGITLWRTPKPLTVNDKESKPVNIDLHVGRRPALAAGNVRSGGDIAMLEYTQVPGRPSLQLLVNHDDAQREFAYAEEDGASLAAARRQGWTVVSMKDDWKTVFADRND